MTHKEESGVMKSDLVMANLFSIRSDYKRPFLTTEYRGIIMKPRVTPLTWEQASDAALRRERILDSLEPRRFARFVARMAEAEGEPTPRISYAKDAIEPFLRVGQHVGICEIGAPAPNPS